MNNLLYTLFGEGTHLNSLQMGLRAAVMFFVTLALIRISGMRTFGTKSAFDNIIVIMLGAILSRGVTGASGFLPTLTAGFVLVVIHRIMAILTVKSSFISKLTQGTEVLLYRKGKIFTRNMKSVSVSHADLIESVRIHANCASLDEIEEAYMERNGEISVIKKNRIVLHTV